VLNPDAKLIFKLSEFFTLSRERPFAVVRSVLLSLKSFKKAATDNPRIFIFSHPEKWVNCTKADIFLVPLLSIIMALHKRKAVIQVFI